MRLGGRTRGGGRDVTARAIWKAELRLGDTRLPVKLYSAVSDRNIRFRLLHSDDLVPLQQRMINPRTKATVEFAEARRGIEVEADRMVILSDEDREALEPEASRDIEVTRFVDPSLINHQWYVRPYYLGPDGSAAAYYAFARALQSRGVEGVARWVMRKKRYLGALQARHGHLILVTLRHAGEVIAATELEAPTGRELAERELDMAEKFVRALEEDFEPERYRDEYRDRVAKLIEIKRQGGTVEPEEYEEKDAPDELLELLEASLEAIQRA
jgi:DNA end-binding protein Ku